MESYSKAAMERAMKVQEVILRAMAKKITWWQAAEIIGISDRSMRRWRERLEEFDYDGLFDRRRGQPSPKRVALATVEQAADRYRSHQPCALVEFLRLAISFVDRQTRNADWLASPAFQDVLEDEIAPGADRSHKKSPGTVGKTSVSSA